MNILRGLTFGAKAKRDAAPASAEKLPQIDAFVDVAVDGSRRRESVSVNSINANELVTRGVAGLRPGASADFLYTNLTGRFRFATICTKVDATQAFFDLPGTIKTIESFADRRTEERVPWIVPVQWRYAPDGEGYGDFLQASMMNVSLRGASLVVDRELKTGAQVEVCFTLDSKADPLVVRCRVVRAAKIETSDKNAVGIRFIEVDRHEKKRLSEFVNEQQRLRHARGVV